MRLSWGDFDARDPRIQINPREIFSSRPNKKVNRLRSEQTEVLDEWFSRRNERDLIIKQNTGSGKTFVGLLAAYSSLIELEKPVVYLVPDKFLIGQVLEEAEKIDLPTTSLFEDPEFSLGHKVLVTTYHKLFNGQSVFGVRGSRRDPMEVGAVIVDDAHSALSVVNESHSLQIPRHSPYFKRIFDLFENDLEWQNKKVTRDIELGTLSSAVRVSPGAVQDSFDSLWDLLYEAAENEDELEWAFFAWPLLANNLRLCSVTFTSHSAEVRLPCPDINLITAFGKAERRLYLTATLQNEGELVSTFGAISESVSRPIVPESASDIGDRIILAPKILDSSCTDTQVREFAYKVSRGWDRREPQNVVVLVPSSFAAEAWADYADETLNVKNMHPVLEEMRGGSHIGLVVLINKYDGVDLPNDACRLLIIDGLYHPLSPFELRRSTALSRSAVQNQMLIQRLEQGMGRGVRDNTDYCAVLVMERDAALLTHRSFQERAFSPATQAQVEFSRDVVEYFTDRSFDEVCEIIGMFLDRDEQLTKRSRQSVASVKYDVDRKISEVEVLRRKAFEAALTNDVGSAARHLQKALDLGIDEQLAGWLLEEKATYLQLLDDDAAESALQAAVKRNSICVKPKKPITYPKLGGPVQAQAINAVNFLSRRFLNADDLTVTLGDFNSGIRWGRPASADDAEDVVKELGQIIGFDSSLPDRERKDGGPDNLWMADGRSFVIELKTEVDRNEKKIFKSETEQLLSSVQWFKNTYKGQPDPLPVLLHPYKVLHHEAHLSSETKLLGPEQFNVIASKVAKFGRHLARSGTWKEEDRVAEALKTYGLTAEQLFKCKN